MNNWANNLFYIVFLGQIFLTSFFVPRLLLARSNRAQASHPPERYPKLYPWPIEYYRIGRAAFTWANRLIFLLGFAFLYGAYALDGGSSADDRAISEAWPAAYGAIQFIPLMALELLGFRQLRRMREANTQSTRKAELRPRRLSDYASPGLLATTVALLAAVVGLDLYVDGFAFDLGSDASQQTLVMLVTNGLLAALGLWHLYGRKQDPYQTSADRARLVKIQLASLMLVSSAMSAFILTRIVGDVAGLHDLDAPLMSLYFQAIVAVSVGYTLRALKPENIDFSVYANDLPVER